MIQKNLNLQETQNYSNNLSNSAKDFQPQTIHQNPQNKLGLPPMPKLETIYTIPPNNIPSNTTNSPPKEEIPCLIPNYKGIYPSTSTEQNEN